MTTKILKGLLPLAIALAFVACDDSSGPGRGATIRVEAHDQLGGAVSGVTLTLTVNDKTMSVVTNATGAATFENVPAGDWMMQVSAPADYRISSTNPVQVSLFAGQVKDISVVLAKEDTSKPPPGGGNEPKE